MHCKDQKESAQETSQKSQGGARGEKQLATREEEEQKKTVDGTVCDRAFVSQKTEKNGWRNCRGIVTKYTQIMRRLKSTRKQN